MKKALAVIIIGSVLVTLFGCGIKEIESHTYVTGIGIDYADGEFIVYTQSQNFANIAKQEGTSSLQESAPMLVGEAKAKSIHAALTAIEQNAPLPFYYGHVNAILISESVIRDQLESVIDFIGQSPFLRYNIWFFGTKENVKDILLGESFFNFSSIYTVFHNPDSLTKNTYIIPIEEYNKFISSYNQPAGSFIIPSLSINVTNFSEDKPLKVSVIDGGFSISQQQYKGWVPKEELVGVKWLAKKAHYIPYSLIEDKVSLIIENPTLTIKVNDGSAPSYDIRFKAKAQITQNLDNISYDEIKKEMEKKIKEEMITTIKKSETMKTDLLNLSEKTYRYHLKKWDLATINSISKDSIKKIEVDVKIIKTVHYKR